MNFAMILISAMIVALVIAISSAIALGVAVRKGRYAHRYPSNAKVKSQEAKISNFPSEQVQKAIRYSRGRVDIEELIEAMRQVQARLDEQSSEQSRGHSSVHSTQREAIAAALQEIATTAALQDIREQQINSLAGHLEVLQMIGANKSENKPPRGPRQSPTA